MGLVVIGAGGFGREVASLLDAAVALPGAGEVPPFEGFVDDVAPDTDLLAAIDRPYLGRVEEVLGPRDLSFVVAIGAPDVRARVDAAAVALGRTPPPGLAHRGAFVGRDVRLGPGAIVCAHASLTTNVEAGRHLHVNLGCVVGHDAVLGDYVTMAPLAQVLGRARVGDRVDLGAGSIVLPGVTVGAGARVGAGAVVTRDVAPGVTVAGVPARPLGA